MSSDELPQHSAEGWAALATDFLDFARARKPGSALVQLFNPTIKNEGWESTHTVVQIVNDDMPFLVDSVTMALAEQGIGVHVLGHPVVTFTRDKAGKLAAVGEGVSESLMHLEIDRQPLEAMPKIEQALRSGAGRRARHRCATGTQMREKMLADRRGPRLAQACRSAMPARTRRRNSCAGPPTTTSPSSVTANTTSSRRARQQVLAADTASGLGLLRGKDVGKPRPLTSLAAHYMPQSGSVDALILTKTNARATVHRPGYMDYIGVLSFDAKGKPVREQRFLGLYTSSAYNRRPWDIPLVRQRHEYVMREVRPGAGQPQRQGAAPHPRDACRATSCSSPARKSCCAPRSASSACRSACAASCSCAATVTAASTRCWSTSRATASTPTCACASRRCSSASCTASTSTPRSASANRRWRSCT